MFYLILVIVLNVLISILFKLFQRYDINTLQAIVTNYIVCVITGSIFIGRSVFVPATFHADWFLWALLMGAGFVSVFNLMGTSTKVDGITITTIANKLSLVIPVIFSVWLYQEHMGIIRLAGIVLAFPAIYLTTKSAKGEERVKSLLLPALLFAGSGLLDTLMKYVQTNYLKTADEQATYAIVCFAVAGSIGFVVLLLQLILNKTVLHWRNLVAGICIGIPNYFSIYFLIRMLNSNFLESSAVIPIANIGILVVSGIAAILFFKEKAGAARLAGLLLSVAAILLIASR